MISLITSGNHQMWPDVDCVQQSDPRRKDIRAHRDCNNATARLISNLIGDADKIGRNGHVRSLAATTGDGGKARVLVGSRAERLRSQALVRKGRNSINRTD